MKKYKPPIFPPSIVKHRRDCVALSIVSTVLWVIAATWFVFPWVFWFNEVIDGYLVPLFIFTTLGSLSVGVAAVATSSSAWSHFSEYRGYINRRAWEEWKAR